MIEFIIDNICPHVFIKASLDTTLANIQNSILPSCLWLRLIYFLIKLIFSFVKKQFSIIKK